MVKLIIFSRRHQLQSSKRRSFQNKRKTFRGMENLNIENYHYRVEGKGFYPSDPVIIYVNADTN